MGFTALGANWAVRPGFPRVLTPCSTPLSPVCKAGAANWQSPSADPAQRPQARPLTASAASSTVGERESTASIALDLPRLGLSREFGARYELMQPVGRGSFKTTHLGRDRATNDKVAVGVLPKERAGSTVEHNLQLIKQEIDITRSMQRVYGVIQLFGVYEDDKNVYFVTELCQGGDLEQYLRNNGAMPEADATVVVRDILRVLAECNAQKVCYADVKPANFLLKSRFPAAGPGASQDGAAAACSPPPPEVRVIDFGCAQHVVEGAQLAKRTGTPLFLPPEMFMRHWGPEADLWSLGMVTYQLLSGKLPFWGGTSDNVSPLMVMQEILGGDISYSGDEWQSLSPEAADFVDRLLDRDYNTRMTAEQALQHPWLADMFCANSSECSLDWEPDQDYNMMRASGNPGRGRGMDRDGVQYCSTEWDGPASLWPRGTSEQPE